MVLPRLEIETANFQFCDDSIFSIKPLKVDFLSINQGSPAGSNIFWYLMEICTKKSIALKNLADTKGAIYDTIGLQMLTTTKVSQWIELDELLVARLIGWHLGWFFYLTWILFHQFFLMTFITIAGRILEECFRSTIHKRK